MQKLTFTNSVVPGSFSHKESDAGYTLVVISFNIKYVHALVVVFTAKGSVTLDLCKETSLSSIESAAGESVDIFASYMYELVNQTLSRWKKRWFVLKTDNCLYSYKNQKVCLH